jgi:hypothetical protein
LKGLALLILLDINPVDGLDPSRHPTTLIQQLFKQILSLQVSRIHIFSSSQSIQAYAMTMSSTSSSTQPGQANAPTVYTHTGRGGAGNYVEAPTAVVSSSTSTRSSTSTSSSPSHLSTGVGGAGNLHISSPSLLRAFCKGLQRKVSVQEPEVVHRYDVGGTGDRKTG